MTVPTRVCPQADAPPLDTTTDPESAEMPTVTKVNGTCAPEPDSEGDMKEGVNSMPPNFEEFIPSERLPDIIDVYVNEGFLREFGEYSEFSERQLERPIKFVRQYPPRTIHNKVIDGGPDLDCPKTGQLDLRCSEFLGKGHHSRVFLAPFAPSTGPMPSAPPVRGAVAVKFSNLIDDARKMLLNEARIYNAFPHDLQGGDVPIVPKFYGCYMPYIKVSDRVNNGNGSGNSDMEEWTLETMPMFMMVPILVLEACGEAVPNYTSVSHSGRRSIGTLLDRLHEAKFVQGSMFHRNILVQPGPLSVPRANRSLDEPSYRIIDFGRGISLGVNISSVEDLKREAEDEQRYARREGLIPY